MRSHTLTVVVTVLMVGTVSSRAHATPNFPGEIQSHLRLQDSPACALCHVGQPGQGTATTPFAVNMKDRGLAPFDTASLDTALDRMAADHVSSIGDCLDDVDELEAGNDPNEPDPHGTCEDAGREAGSGPVQGASPLTSPRYGCVGSVAPAPANDSPWAALVAGALALAWRRRRRSSSASA